MVEYKINKYADGFAYAWDNDSIYLSVHKETLQRYNAGEISEDKLIEYVADQIKHEHMHRALYKHLGYVECVMYDYLSELFDKTELINYILKGTNCQAWRKTDRCHRHILHDFNIKRIQIINLNRYQGGN